MKKTIIFLIAVLAAGTAFIPAYGATQPPVQNRELKGYITIGNSVIGLPTQLQTGDRITLATVNGVVVYDQRVHDGFFRIDTSKLRPSLYLVSILRNGVEVAAIRLPFKAS